MRTSTRYFKTFSKMMWMVALLLVVFAAGCDRDHGGAAPGAGAGTGAGPAGAVSLGTASTYGIMATASLKYSGTGALATVIYGDAAINPAAASYVTGFNTLTPNADGANTSTQVTGTIHVRDAEAIKAQEDLLIAYTDLSTRVAPAAVPTPTGHGGTFATGVVNLSGMVLLPGIYAVGTMGSDTYALSNISGPLVLDAEGNADAVFIFQAYGITTTDGTVLLRNGARPTNVYWVVTTAAVIGNNLGGYFQGTVVAGGDITVDEHVEGRMLAGALGAGNLTISHNNVISVPAP